MCRRTYGLKTKSYGFYYRPLESFCNNASPSNTNNFHISRTTARTQKLASLMCFPCYAVTCICFVFRVSDKLLFYSPNVEFYVCRWNQLVVVVKLRLLSGKLLRAHTACTPPPSRCRPSPASYHGRERYLRELDVGKGSKGDNEMTSEVGRILGGAEHLEHLPDLLRLLAEEKQSLDSYQGDERLCR